MITIKDGRVFITGADEIVFSVVLFMLDLALDRKAPARRHVEAGIKYFRDLGLAVDCWLFDEITAKWNTRLAWGTSAAHIAFPMDSRDPGSGSDIINRGRRRQIWHSINSAVGCKTDVTAPTWVLNTPGIGDDLPVGDVMLDVMAEVIGDELLDRLSGTGKSAPEPQPVNPLPIDNRPSRDPMREIIDGLKIKFQDNPHVEFGFKK